MSNIVRSAYEDVSLPTLPYAEFIWKNFDDFGDQEAMVCGMTGRSYTYELLRLFSRKLGSALVKRGLRKGDVLGLICPNIPEFAITFLGVACVGGIITTINPTYTAEEIARQLQDSGAKFVVTVGPLADKVKEAVALCPLVEETFSIGDAEGLTPLHQIAADLGDSLVECPPINIAEDVLVMPYSSGTTGLPKGVMLTHQNITGNICQMMHPQISYTPKPAETILAILPFFHSYAMTAIMGVGLHFGGRILTLPRFETDTFLKAIHDHKPNIMYLVPPLVNFLATYPELNVDDLRNLHTIVCGAAPLSKNIVSTLLDRLHPQPIAFQEGYGMTELSPVSHVSPRDSGRIGTCGVLVPNTEAKIVDLNTGAALGPGFEGELCVRGPQVMKGYLNNPRATRETIDRDGWLHTGDIANYDDQGFFHVIDRMKELIKVKGLQVSPSELEDVLLTHPGIEDVAVIGVPDPMAGELPKAYIVPRNSFVSKEDIFAFTESKLAPHKHLKGGIEFVSMIPKTQTGKILRRELKEQIRSQA
uniref:Luciferin 4-monooxygenase n=1 Tax=Hemiscolopendra marginata TaxID=943146 RepID=A0A646QDR8_9MYRI